MLSAIANPTQTMSSFLIGISVLPALPKKQVVGALETYHQNLDQRYHHAQSRAEVQQPLPPHVEAMFDYSLTMIAAEKKYNGICQMGNQGHSGGQRMQFKTWVDEGIIKNVRRVDACMNKARRWHPWGNVTVFPPEEQMPEGMDWAVWAGTAPKRSGRQTSSC